MMQLPSWETRYGLNYTNSPPSWRVVDKTRGENEEIIFYQMNGLVLGTFSKPSLELDMNRSGLLTPGAFSLAHNVATREGVRPVMERLAATGGRVLREADAPPHGGFRGYVSDPDDHAWEIAWNPAWMIDERGMVQFSL